jgi:hypothetical protein
MLALLIEDITLLKADQIAIHVRFRGGETRSVSVEAPKTLAMIRKFKPEVINQLDQLLETCADHEAADRLNALGYRNWENNPFTARKVLTARRAYKLKSLFQRMREQGWVSADELAPRLKVSPAIIHEWGRAGFLSRQYYGVRRCLFEPVKSVTIRKGKWGRMIPAFTRIPKSKRETV